MTWAVVLGLIAVAAVVGWRLAVPSRSPGGTARIEAPDDAAAAHIAAYRRLAEGKTLAGEGKHAEAVAIFEEVAKSRAGHAYGWDAEIQAAHSQGVLGQYPEAIARFDRVIADCSYPDQIPGAQIDRADILSRSGRHDDAVVELETLVARLTGYSDRICADALLALARIYQRMDRPGLMRSALERISEDYPGDEDVCRHLADRALARLQEEYPARQEQVIEEMASSGGYHRVDELPAGTTSWKAEAGPYLVCRPLVVRTGDTLQIGPGTQVRFAVNCGLEVKGTLDIAGEADKPVLLLPLSDDSAKDWWNGIDLESGEGNSSLRFCRIIGAEIGVRVKGGHVQMEACTLVDCGRSGVLAEGNTRLAMAQCHITGGGRAGVECLRGVTLEMTGGTIIRMKARGVVLRQTGGQSVIRGLSIEQCGLEGILLQGDSPVTIESCRILRNGATGVRSAAGAQPTLVDTEVSGNGGNGIWVEERWTGTVRGCTIKDNKLAGILAEVRCAGEVDNNQIQANAGGGLCLRLASTTAVTKNRFVRNGGPGLVLDEGSKPEIERDNEFIDNAEATTRGALQ